MTAAPEPRPAMAGVSEAEVEAAARSLCLTRGVNPDCQHQVYPGDSLFASPDGYWPERKGEFPRAATPQVWGWRLKIYHARPALTAAAQVRQAERDADVEPRSGRMAWHLKKAEARAEAAEARASKAVEVLRHVEWQQNYGLDDNCPVCLKFRRNGHAPSCSLAALLSTTPDLGGEANDTTRGGGNG